MPNETIYLNSKRYEVLKDIPGENVSQKVGWIIDQYAAQLGDK